MSVRKIDDYSLVRALYIEVYFRDQYISRGGLWRLKNSLLGTSAHVGKTLELNGAYRARVGKINANNDEEVCVERS